MNYLKVKMGLISVLVVIAFISCSKLDVSPTENSQTEKPGNEVIEKKPGWAFLGLSIYFGESSLNPHYDPEMPASSGNPLTVCLGRGLCKISIGASSEDNSTIGYPRKTESTELEIYFDTREMEPVQLDNFRNDEFTVHDDIELRGDWLKDIGFSTDEYTIASGVYDVMHVDKYLVVVF